MLKLCRWCPKWMFVWQSCVSLPGTGLVLFYWPYYSLILLIPAYSVPAYHSPSLSFLIKKGNRDRSLTHRILIWTRCIVRISDSIYQNLVTIDMVSSWYIFRFMPGLCIHMYAFYPWMFPLVNSQCLLVTRLFQLCSTIYSGSVGGLSKTSRIATSLGCQATNQ